MSKSNKNNQKASILFLVRLYYPHIGGVEKHVENITNNLLDKGFSVTIVTEQYKENLKEKETAHNLTILRIPISKNLFIKKFYVWFWFIKHLDLLFKNDIIHIHDVFYWMMPFRILIFWKKIYITFHGYEDYPLRRKWIIGRKVAELLTNGNICVGSFMKKWYGTNPTYVSYGGTELSNIYNTKPKEESVLFFGRLDNQTNIKEYLEGFKLVLERNDNFKLTVVGEGEYEVINDKQIKVLPFTNNIEKYIGQNKFIFVSRYLSILEALSQKKLVFAYYDNPIKKDYVLLTPFKKFIIPVSSPQALSDKLIFFAKHDEEYKRLTKLGYDWVVNNATWENVLGTYLKLWKEKL